MIPLPARLRAVTHADPFPLILVLGVMAMLPLLVVMTTSFMKIAVVLG